MTAQAFARLRPGRCSPGILLAVTLLVALGAIAGIFISYVLWPTWPSRSIALDAPPMPVTVADVLFNVPPAAVRVPVQRHPGTHERIDLVFLWPSLEAPRAQQEAAAALAVHDPGGAVPQPGAEDRVFVTIAALGDVLTPLDRLRDIYPRYIEAQASAGPDGLGVLPFRAGTPYEGEDLVYFADKPEKFFARCTRTVHTVSGTCIDERVAGAVAITLRFPRAWLDSDWRAVDSGFDRLVGRLHPSGE